MSSFNGREPVRPQLRLAVLGDSDSHAFHDAVSLNYGTSEARGGPQQASTWQWTEILGQLRPMDIDQGPFGEVGSNGAGAWLRRHLLGSLVRQRKEDFRYNFAVSGAVCTDLVDGSHGQVPSLLAEMDRDPRGWSAVPAVAIIRIGINSLGKKADLDTFARTGPDAGALARVQECGDAVAQAVASLKGKQPSLHIILVGILNNVDWPPLHLKFQSAREQANIAAVMDAYDNRLRNLADSVDGVTFFDDRAFFRSRFGGRDGDGKPAYQEVKLGGRRSVTVSQGDEPWHAVIGDGHAGTVWNGLWAGEMVKQFNQIPSVNITPITLAEVARMADPDGSFGLSSVGTPKDGRPESAPQPDAKDGQPEASSRPPSHHRLPEKMWQPSPRGGEAGASSQGASQGSSQGPSQSGQPEDPLQDPSQGSQPGTQPQGDPATGR